MTDAAAIHALRCACWDNGYRPVAIYSPGARLRDGTPIKGAGKRPASRDWLALALCDPPDAVVRAVSTLACNTGIATRQVIGCDIDVLIQEVVDQIVRQIEATLGPTPLHRIGRAPKILLCYRADEPFAKLTTPNYRMPDGSLAHLEILGQGQQFVAFGIHPDTRQPYRWLDGSPETVPLAALPAVTAMQARDLVGEAEAILLAAGGVAVKPPAAPHDPATPRRPSATGQEGFFRAVNNAALANIAVWATALHADFRDRGNSGWRLSSADLDRAFEEDVAVHPTGIWDFGEELPLTAVDLVIRLGGAPDARQAAFWLCGRLGVEPAQLGWHSTRTPEDTTPVPPRRNGHDPEAEARNADPKVGRGGSEPPPPPPPPPGDTPGDADDDKVPLPPPDNEDEHTADPTLPDGTPAEFSDEYLALRFSAHFHASLRYLALFGRWYWWLGTHWCAEHTPKVFDFARAICRAASAAVTDDDKLARDVASARTVAAIERLARADRRHATEECDWDRDLDTFVTQTATIELKTGKVRESRREDMNTKIAAVHADPNCPIPLWTAFLDTITAGDKALRKYLQRMAGYCMTGLTIEHVLFFLYGTGANGKGVFLGTLSDILGDYAAIAPMELFFESQSERHPTELAHLWGARLALAQETERNRRWAEAKLKALTGGDTITARFMRQDFFDFVPRFKLVIAGNHKPSLRGVDEAIRRRLHLVPFTVTIPAKERDLNLREKLRGEWPGILWWAAQGAVEWHQIGLAPPPAVTAASEAYFAEQDRLGQWLEECCVEEKTVSALVADLFGSWKKWSEDAHERPGSQKAFSQTLEQRGFTRDHDPRTRRARFFGLRLRSHDDL